MSVFAYQKSPMSESHTYKIWFQPGWYCFPIWYAAQPSQIPNCKVC